MIISGDISVNPGPVKHPCGGCQRPVAKTHRAVQCDVCYYWWHIKCANISPATYTDMCGSDDPWVCNECNSFRFSESFFDKSICVDMDSDNKNENENVDDIFDELKDIKKKHPNKFICSYININSFRNKFCFIKDLLISNTCDMLTSAETKLDESFSSAQFQIENFHLWRADRTANGGGLLTYIRSDLPSDRKHKLECQIIESIFTEIVVKNEKWIICGIYRPPSMSDKEFSNDFIQTFDQLSVKYDNILILGDLNYNMLLDNSKSTPSNNVCDIFDFSNLIKKKSNMLYKTCFTNTYRCDFD
jgi:exonuclease III